MPSHIVAVHNDPSFLKSMATALREAGHEVAPFADPMAAWLIMQKSNATDILITGMEFSVEKSHALSLARLGRLHNPDIWVLFAAAQRYEPYTRDIGVLMASPITAIGVVEAVRAMMKIKHQS
jgi:DNA-binding NtrC family response regulator